MPKSSAEQSGAAESGDNSLWVQHYKQPLPHYATLSDPLSI